MPLKGAYLDILRGERSVFTPGHPADDALLALLVHTAFSDGVIDDHELTFLAGVLPGRSKEALRGWVAEVGGHPLDLAAITDALPEPDDRWRCLRFAATMAWKDGHVADEELAFLSELSSAMDMPPNAVMRSLEETNPGKRLEMTAEKIKTALAEIRWDAVQHTGGALVSPELLAQVPENKDLVARIGLDGVEMLGIYVEGIVGRFQQGPAWLPWTEVVTYSRGFGIGAALRVHTEDGRSWTLVDARLNGVSLLVDRLFGLERVVAERPAIEHRTLD